MSTFDHLTYNSVVSLIFLNRFFFQSWTWKPSNVSWALAWSSWNATSPTTRIKCSKFSAQSRTSRIYDERRQVKLAAVFCCGPRAIFRFCFVFVFVFIYVVGAAPQYRVCLDGCAPVKMARQFDGLSAATREKVERVIVLMLQVDIWWI